MNKANRKYLLVILVLIAGYFLYTYVNQSNSLEGKFLGMRNSLMCTIKNSSESNEKNKQIALVDLETDKPRAIFPSGTASPMKKVSDNDSILVIQLVAEWTGSTDTITLYKGTGKFEREAKGSVGGDYSYQSSGQCI